jgi:YD repeat-containing protein
MKNIQGTEENLELFNENGVRVYAYRKLSIGFSYERTYDSNGNELTYKNSSGHSSGYTRDSNGNILTYKNSSGFRYECTYDSDNKELTYKDSNGETRGFDKTYTPKEVEFIKRAVEYYWQDWSQEHPDNKNDLKLTEQILSK